MIIYPKPKRVQAMTFLKLLGKACDHAKYLYRLDDISIAGVADIIESASQAEDYSALTQLVVDARYDERSAKSDAELKRLRSVSLYMEFIYDIVTVGLALQDKPVSMYSITSYVKIMEGYDHEQ